MKSVDKNSSPLPADLISKFTNAAENGHPAESDKILGAANDTQKCYAYGS